MGLDKKGNSFLSTNMSKTDSTEYHAAARSLPPPLIPHGDKNRKEKVNLVGWD